MIWRSVFGDEVRVEKYHKFDDDGVVEYVNPPEGRDKWVAKFDEYQELYYPKRKQAIDAARAFMRAAYIEDELREARRIQREEEGMHPGDSEMEVDPEKFQPEIT